jgi:hypothetical protein
VLTKAKVTIHQDWTKVEVFGQLDESGLPAGKSYLLERTDKGTKVSQADGQPIADPEEQTLADDIFESALEPRPLDQAIPETMKIGDKLVFEGEEFLRVMQGTPDLLPGGLVTMTLANVQGDIARFEARIMHVSEPRPGMVFDSDWAGTISYDTRSSRLTEISLEGTTEHTVKLEAPGKKLTAEVEGKGRWFDVYSFE